MPIYIFYGNWSSQTFRKYSAVPGFGGIGILEINIACHYPHHAQTEEIWWKPALEGKRDSLLFSEEGRAKIQGANNTKE